MARRSARAHFAPAPFNTADERQIFAAFDAALGLGQYIEFAEDVWTNADRMDPEELPAFITKEFEALPAGEGTLDDLLYELEKRGFTLVRTRDLS